MDQRLIPTDDLKAKAREDFPNIVSLHEITHGDYSKPAQSAASQIGGSTNMDGALISEIENISECLNHGEYVACIAIDNEISCYKLPLSNQNKKEIKEGVKHAGYVSRQIFKVVTV